MATSNIKISELGTMRTGQVDILTDAVPIVHKGTTYKITVKSLFDGYDASEKQVVWGDIKGILTNQTDLVEALSLKTDVSVTDSLIARVAQNETDIGVNTTDITQNSTGISQNATDIAQNASDILSKQDSLGFGTPAQVLATNATSDGTEWIDGGGGTGLEALDEGNGTGWRLKGFDPATHGNIGVGAVDLTKNYYTYDGFGATGAWSFATNSLTTASGYISVAMGWGAEAKGHKAVAIGSWSESNNLGSISLGHYNTHTNDYGTAVGYHTQTPPTYGAVSLGAYNVGTNADTMVEIGIGTYTTRKNGLEIFTDGTVTAPSTSVALIDSRGSKALTTVDWVNDKLTAGGGNLIKDGNGYRVNGLNTATPGFNGVSLGYNTTATGYSSTAVGHNSNALGYYSFASNLSSTAKGNVSFASGRYTVASGYASTAQGEFTYATGTRSHSSGLSCTARGSLSHTEGSGVNVYGGQSHGEGGSTYIDPLGADITTAILGTTNANTFLVKSTANFSVGDTLSYTTSVHSTFGRMNYSNGGTITVINGNEITVDITLPYPLNFSITSAGNADGVSLLFNRTRGLDWDGTNAVNVYETVNGVHSHTEGFYNVVRSKKSHSEGERNINLGDYSHTEGRLNKTVGSHSSAGGYDTWVGSNSITHGKNIRAIQYASATFGYSTVGGYASITGGFLNMDSDNYSGLTVGWENTNRGAYNIVGGFYNNSNGRDELMVGEYNLSAKGYDNIIGGNSNFVDGSGSIISGDYNINKGNRQLTVGNRNVNIGDDKTVLGMFNEPKTDTILEIGNGITGTSSYVQESITTTGWSTNGGAVISITDGQYFTVDYTEYAKQIDDSSWWGITNGILISMPIPPQYVEGDVISIGGLTDNTGFSTYIRLGTSTNQNEFITDYKLRTPFRITPNADQIQVYIVPNAQATNRITGSRTMTPSIRLFTRTNTSNALEVYKDGIISAPSLTDALIDGATNDTLVTKGWVTANSGGSGGGELVKDGNGYRLNGQSTDTLGTNAINLSIGGEATGNNSLSFGANAKATLPNSLSMGYYAEATAGGAIALGDFTEASATSAVAIGSHATASGIHAVAWGYGTASARYSTSWGKSSIASGDGSISFGNYALANASYASAIGASSKAYATGATALAGGEVKTGGSYSIAIGQNAKTNETRTISMGYNTIVPVGSPRGNLTVGRDNDVATNNILTVGNGANSSNKSNALEVEFGGLVKAPSALSADIGLENNLSKVLITKEYADATYLGGGSSGELIKDGLGYRITGQSSDTLGVDAVNLGKYSTATGKYSTALGYYSTASGNYSTAFGAYSTASGYYSTALSASVAGGRYSTAMSRSTASGNYSTAMGDGAKATHSYSVAMGYYVYSGGDYSTTLGKSNIITADTVLVVGIGASPSNRLNALEVYNDGRVVAPELTDALITSGGAKSLVTKEYIDLREFVTLSPTANSAPNNSFFVDSADNLLKFKDNSGVVKTVTLA